MSSESYTSTVKRKGGFVRKFLMIFIPIGILGMFIIATIAIIAANQKPKEKKRAFNTLAVIAAYACLLYTSPSPRD